MWVGAIVWLKQENGCNRLPKRRFPFHAKIVKPCFDLCCSFGTWGLAGFECKQRSRV